MEIENNLVNNVKDELLQTIISSFEKINNNTKNNNNVFETEKNNYIERISILEKQIENFQNQINNKDFEIIELKQELENMNKFSYTKKLDKLLKEEKMGKEILQKRYNLILKENQKLKSEKNKNLAIKNNELIIQKETTKNDDIMIRKNKKNQENINQELSDNEDEDGFKLITYKNKVLYVKTEKGKEIVYKKTKNNEVGEILGYMKNNKIYKIKK